MSYTRKPACVNRVIFGAFSVLAWTQGAVTSLITTWGVHRKISVKNDNQMFLILYCMECSNKGKFTH